MLGMNPVWASEVEPFPIRVTSARLPNMKHLGSITEINGGEIEPVDIIVGGSPCQDLSISGSREGLVEGKRSSLFFEQIRVIKEMRVATNGQYPRHGVWENVPGAFSSNQGRDFLSVLQSFASVSNDTIRIPEPPAKNGRIYWPKAGVVVGDGFSIAWRVLDAQFWGVPQRRKRIFLVASFGDERAGEVLLKYTGLPRDSQPRIGSEQSPPADPMGCLGRGGSGIAFKERGGCAGGGKGILCSENAFTVSTQDPQAVCYPIDQHQQDSRFKLCVDGIVPTMSRKMGAGGNNTPMILEDHSYAADIRNMSLNDELCSTLQAKSNGGHSLNYTPPVIQPVYIDRAAFNQGKNALYDPQFVEDMATTLVAKGPGALCHENVPVAYSVGNGQLNQTEPELIAKPLDTMHDRQAVVIEKDQPRRYIIRRLTPLECGRLQGFPDFWLDGVKGSDTDKYKMWGNGMALPCMLAVFNGIKKSYGQNHHTGEVNG